MVQLVNQGEPDNNGKLIVDTNKTSTVMPDLIKDHHISALGTNCLEDVILVVIVIFYILVHPCHSKP